MKKRRIVVGLVVALVVAGTFSVTVFAAGSGQNEETVEKYILCTLESCTRVDYHSHGGITYAPHSQNDGHDYHVTKVEDAVAAQTHQGLCAIQDCTQTGDHVHDGGIYSPHHVEDGHAYHSQQHESPSKHSGGNSGHNSGRHH